MAGLIKLVLFTAVTSLCVVQTLQDDRNKCVEDRPCHDNAFCQNVQGSYTCSCKPGFAGDGKTCAQDLISQNEQAKTAINRGLKRGNLAVHHCYNCIGSTQGLMVAAFDPGFNQGLEGDWAQYGEEYGDYGSSDDSDYSA